MRLCSRLPLSEHDFRQALAFALKRYLPDIALKEAADLLMAHIGIDYGAAGYTWTSTATAELARDYASQLREAT